MGADCFFVFGPFRLDATTRILLRDGTVVPLTPKALDILTVLIANRGSLVRKEELMKAVWPETFVEESNLTQNISLLRRALSEAPGGQSYIETIPKRGYRFVGSVAKECEEAAGGSGGRRWRLGAGALLAVLVAGAAVWFHFARPPAGPPVPLLKTVPLTSFLGFAGPPAFSPAGNQVAFSWDGGRQSATHIYIKLIGAGPPYSLRPNQERAISVPRGPRMAALSLSCGPCREEKRQ